MLKNSQNRSRQMPDDYIDDPLDTAAESFLARLRNGETPSLSEYVSRYPDLADEIRDLFPMLAIVERVGNGLTDGDGVKSPYAPKQVGDYRIVGEIGRGGMGVVFEAHQTKLGRRVALKVLPEHDAKDTKRLLRFQREARAAARLHHTNIVPVYEVGVDGGVSFYSMQFIEGESLSSVWSQMHRTSESQAMATTRSQTAEEAGDDLAASETRAYPERAARPDCDASETTSKVQSLVDTVIAAPRLQYFHNMTRVAAQVVEALAYAHSKGVLHRDIKPSNVILDTQGRAWVTDFGLAKTENDDLTRTGDIVGTLRYMSPERFHGGADARSDIYGAGLTLYEFLTLRPAFTSSERNSLLHQIQEVDPPRPRKIDPTIPRDLETIVLKAIDKDPGRRYRTAADFAADLNRFLEDRPIVARRTSALEHAWRWCRRNRAVASLVTTTVALFAVLVLVVVVGLARHAQQQRQLADTEREHAFASERNERLAKQALFEARRSEARAKRWSGQVGQRVEGLNALRNAVTLLSELQLPPAAEQRARQEMVGEAINCLGLYDLASLRKVPPAPAGTTILCFDLTLSRYALAHNDGRITIRSLVDGASLLELPSTNDDPFQGLFSPNGRFLVTRDKSGKRHANVWDLEEQRRVMSVEKHKDGFGADFSIDSRRIAIARNELSIGIFSTSDGELLDSISLEPHDATAFSVKFSPDNSRLAVSLFNKGRMLIWNLSDRTWEQRAFPCAADLAWYPDGLSLASSSSGSDPRIFVWDLATGKRRFTMHGHNDFITSLKYSPRGDVLASYGWDGRIWLWNARTGRAITNVAGETFGFDQDGGFAYAPDRIQAGSEVTVGELVGGAELRTLCEPLAPGGGPTRVSIHPRGRLMASCGDDGVRLWDLQTYQPIAQVIGVAGKSTPHQAVMFTPDGSDLITSGVDGVQQWPIHIAASKEMNSALEVHVGAAKQLLESKTVERADLSNDGSRLVVLDESAGGKPRLIHTENGSPNIFLVPGDTSRCAISNDGRWVAISRRHAPVGIWETDTGKLMQTLPSQTVFAGVSFSRDGRWLVTGTDEYRFWQVSKRFPWPTQQTIPRSGHTSGGTPRAAFSKGGKLIAIGFGDRSVKLLHGDSLDSLAMLRPPASPRISSLSVTEDKLVLASHSHHAIWVWDLVAVQRALEGLGLDWGYAPQAFSTAGRSHGR